MSVRVMADVWDCGPDDATLTSVLLALANFCDDAGGNCFPGTPLLAKRTRYSERTVIRALQALEEQGWISVLQRGNGRPVNGTALEQAQYKTHYQINVKKLKGCQVVTFSNKKGDTETGKGDTDVKKGDTDDIPPYPHNGVSVSDPPEIRHEPDAADTRVLCELVGIFEIRQQETMHRRYKAFVKSSGLSVEAARQRMVSQWELYQREIPKLEWSFATAAKFFESAIWNLPSDKWPYPKSAKKKDPFENMKFINTGGKK